MLQHILDWDRKTFIYLNNLGLERFDTFWTLVTNITSWIPLFLLFLWLLFLKHPRRDAIFKGLTVVALSIFILLATKCSKEVVRRIRPNNDQSVSSLIRILRSPADYSFFSGHAASSFAITTLIVLFLRKHFRWVWLFYLWPLLFSLSRIYVGVHYPTDLIAGSLVGIVSALLFYRIYGRFISPYSASARP